MRTLSDREQRLVRFSAAGLALYLAFIFIGSPLQKRRDSYNQLVRDAQSLREKIKPYAVRTEAVQKLMENYQLDPAKLSSATVVGEASTAIQKAAMSSGIQVGPVREDHARSASRELASVRFEGTGPVAAVTGFLKRLESLGYPLIVDSVQITPQPQQQGQVKIVLTIAILDFDQWKEEGPPHA